MITIGKFVLYVLTADDATKINRRRTTGVSIAERIAKPGAWHMGAQAHIGTMVNAGDTFPLLVTKVWTNTCVNGQVFLDGNDVYWVQSANLDTTAKGVQGEWFFND